MKKEKVEKKSEMEIKLCRVKDYVPIEDLQIHPDNPRQIKQERLEELRRSIIEKGFYEPIVVWERDGIILSGNHRYMVVQDLIREGYEFISPDGEAQVLPCVIVDASEEVAEAILFETNNHYAEWIDEKLQKALVDAKEAGRDITSFGFTVDEVDAMLKSALTDADEMVKSSKKLEPEDDDLDLDGDSDTDEEEPLMLPKAVHQELVDLLSKINPSSVAEAVQGLVKFAKDNGVDVLWKQKKKKTVLRKKKT